MLPSFEILRRFVFESFCADSSALCVRACTRCIYVVPGSLSAILGLHQVSLGFSSRFLGGGISNYCVSHFFRPSRAICDALHACACVRCVHLAFEPSWLAHTRFCSSSRYVWCYWCVFRCIRVARNAQQHASMCV